MVFPTRARQVGDRTDFYREESLDLRCLTMLWAAYVVEEVSKYLDILTLEASGIKERPLF